MSYIVGQYNKNRNIPDDSDFMTLVTSGTAKRRNTSGDSEVSGITGIFKDECVQVSALVNTSNYYFHGKIKRMISTDQIFYIKLVNYSVVGTDEVEQYLKTITVSRGNPDDWVDVEFIFSPLVTFDCILFELQRTQFDYKEEERFPVIAYEELSIVNNIISTKIKDGTKLIKIGVQSRPGLLMCINGEEIRTCRTGIYELKNGMMTVNFFSVCSPIKESGTDMSSWIANVNNQYDAIIARQEAGEITNQQAAELKSAINSNCFFGSGKQGRSIDSFTLDYMYKE